MGSSDRSHAMKRPSFPLLVTILAALGLPRWTAATPPSIDDPACGTKVAPGVDPQQKLQEALAALPESLRAKMPTTRYATPRCPDSKQKQAVDPPTGMQAEPVTIYEGSNPPVAGAIQTIAGQARLLFTATANPPSTRMPIKLTAFPAASKGDLLVYRFDTSKAVTPEFAKTILVYSRAAARVDIDDGVTLQVARNLPQNANPDPTYIPPEQLTKENYAARRAANAALWNRPAAPQGNTNNDRFAGHDNAGAPWRIPRDYGTSTP